jgi:hypothetical protein
MTAPLPPATRSPRALVLTLMLGTASAGLYLLLYLFADELQELAAVNRLGEHKIYALVPIGIALIFSFVHGAFTGHFWDLLGFRAKK